MDILLIVNITGIIVKIAIHVAETHLEGRVSQNSDIALSLCFILCRKLNTKKKKKKLTKVFALKSTRM